MNEVAEEKSTIHQYMGEHKIPYNNGNGLQVKYFSVEGDENDSYINRYTKICVAGKPLGDE